MSFTKNQIEKLEKSGYRFVGKHGHAAVKTCHSMESNPTDAFRCLLQFQIANRNANSAGET